MGLFARKKPIDTTNWEAERLAKNVSEAEIRYLEVLRREIGNLIMASDPDLMERSYRKAHAYESAIRKDPARWQADEVALTTRIRVFEDFDAVAVHHFVPYSEVGHGMANDELVDRYNDVTNMLIFLNRRYHGEQVKSLFDERQEKALRETIRRVKDANMVRRIKAAMGQFYAYRSGFERDGNSAFGVELIYSDAEVEVFKLPHTPGIEIDYGVIFKKTDEQGIYSFAVVDGNKTYHSYARSDRTFETRQHMIDR